MKIYEYLNTRVDPMTLRKIHFTLNVDDEGEPYIKVEYIDENQNKIDIFSTSEEINAMKKFASEVTRIVRDMFKIKFVEIRPIVYDDKTGYYKYLFTEDQRIPHEIYYDTVISENILLGLVLEREVSKVSTTVYKTNALIKLTEDIVAELKEKKYNCEFKVEPKKTHKLS